MTLAVHQLLKSYGGRPVVNGVSVRIEPGEVVGLLGPNGAGKTTSFYAMVGIIQPDGGEILLDGASIRHLPIHERARLGLGYLPQEPSIFRKLSVADNLRLVLEFQHQSKAAINNRIETLLDEFGLSRFADTPAIQLSGGERRRLEIARALATDPRYLLLDEPFTGIDPIAIQDIHGLIRQLKERGLGILLTDHNPKATLAIVDRAYIVHDGRIIFEGTNREVAVNPLVRQYYLGEDFHL
ncbi:MAG: LPS export ABC transporter ATP-binding protein [Vampirovibrionales bacterium]|nr:LPS export ABC transporter ATP-binding protein [Vampirovibrionales bacterium]